MSGGPQMEQDRGPPAGPSGTDLLSPLTDRRDAVAALGDLDTGPLAQRRHDVDVIHRVELEVVPEVDRRIEGFELVGDVGCNTGDRFDHGGAGLIGGEGRHGISGLSRYLASVVRKRLPLAPSEARWSAASEAAL